MRISVLSLHTSPAAQPGQGDAGGMNVYVDQSVRALAAAGHTVDVFTADPGGIDGLGEAGGTAGAGCSNATGSRLEIAENIVLHHLPVGAESKDELADAIDELAHLLARDPDFSAAELIWAHYWISAEAALRTREMSAGGRDSATAGECASDSAASRPQVLVSMHTIGAVKNRDSETSHERPQRLHAESRIADKADLLVANTPAERRDLIHELGADPSSVVIARPGVDHGLYTPGEQSAARARLGFGDDEVIVLCVGRMQFIKGTDVAVDALAALREANPRLAARTRGILLGAASGTGATSGARVAAGPRVASSAFLRELTAAIAAEPSIEVRPPVPAHILVDYYRSADLLLVPSRSESFGLVAAEAAASGLPALASAVGGLPEVVEHGRSGMLIADHNPRHWATALEGLLLDAELRAEFAAHAVERSQRFDWARTVDVVLEALASATADAEPGGEVEADPDSHTRCCPALGAC